MLSRSNIIINKQLCRRKLHIDLYYVKYQQDATLAVLFISNCKITLHVFGCFLRPSSGVLKTVVTATGSCHDVQDRLPTAQVQ